MIFNCVLNEIKLFDYENEQLTQQLSSNQSSNEIQEEQINVYFGYISTCPNCEAKRISFELAYRDLKYKKDQLIDDYKLKYYPKNVNFIKIDCIKNQQFCSSLNISSYPFIGLQMQYLNNSYLYQFDNKAKSLSHWLVAMMQPTIINSDDEGDVLYAAGVLKKKSFFIINYCNQSLSNFESEFSKYKGQILVASIKKQNLCNENQTVLYAQRNDNKYYYNDSNQTLADFILSYKNRAIGPISIEEYKQWIQERRLGLLVVNPFYNQEIIEEIRKITDDYGMNLAYTDISYYKFQGLFDKLEISEESDLPIFVVIDNQNNRHYLQHVDNVTQIISIIKELDQNPQIYQTISTSSQDDDVVDESKKKINKICQMIVNKVKQMNPKIIIGTISLFALTTVVLCIISCNKHKK